MKCKHCGSEFEGKFCPECGTRAELETTVVSQNAQEQKMLHSKIFRYLKQNLQVARKKAKETDL